MQGEDLTGTWILASTEGADDFLAATGMSWMKRQAVAAAMTAATATHVYDQKGQQFVTRSQRGGGEWAENNFVADGSVVVAEEDGGEQRRRATSNCSYFDEQGRLVQVITYAPAHLFLSFPYDCPEPVLVK